MSSSESPTLPPREAANTPLLPSREAPPAAAAAAQDRAARIRISTEAGGLKAIPPGFDDLDGDWRVIASPSFFERLYLDASQQEAITPAMVRQNHDVLAAFWKEKIAALQTGSAQTQICTKFGGPHRSADLVRSYPRDLKAAADRLLAPDGIATYREELQTQRREAARKTIEPVLAVIFANDTLDPAETRTCLAQAVAAGFEMDEAAALLQKEIIARDLQPSEPPRGDTLDARLASVQWRARTHVAATPPPPLATPPVLKTAAVPTRRPFLGVAAVVAIFAIAAFALTVMLVLRPSEGVRTGPTTSSAALLPSVDTGTVAQPETQTPPEVDAGIPAPQPATVTIVAEPQPARTDTAAEELARLQDELARRRQETDRAEAERAAAEARRILELRASIGSGLQRLESYIGARDVAAARPLLAEIRNSATGDAQHFGAELAALDMHADALTELEKQRAAVEGKLADIEALNAERRFPEAINLANRLLKQAELTGDTVERAQKALAFAEEELGKLVNGSDMKVRTRRTNKGRSR